MMVKNIGFVVAMTAFSSNAMAEIVKAETPFCISKRSIALYEQPSDGDVLSQLKEDLIDRATCFVKSNAEEVIVLDQAGDFTKVQLASGHKVWVSDVRIIEGNVLPEDMSSVEVSQETITADMLGHPAVVMPEDKVTSETVAKKSGWVEKVKEYIPFW